MVSGNKGSPCAVSGFGINTCQRDTISAKACPLGVLYLLESVIQEWSPVCKHTIMPGCGG